MLELGLQLGLLCGIPQFCSMQMLQKFDERFQTDVCSIVISKVDPKYLTEKSGPRLQKG